MRHTLLLILAITSGIAFSTTLESGIVIDGPSPFLRGDCNADGRISFADGVAMMAYSFEDGVEPPCLAACNFDGTGALDLTASLYFFNALFQSGPPLPAPNTSCARSDDRWDVALGCRHFECSHPYRD